VVQAPRTQQLQLTGLTALNVCLPSNHSQTAGLTPRRSSIVAPPANIIDVAESSQGATAASKGVAWLGEVLLHAAKAGAVDVLEVVRARCAASERKVRDELRPALLGAPIPSGLAHRLQELAAFRYFHPQPSEQELQQATTAATAAMDNDDDEELTPSARLARQVLAPSAATSLPCGEHDDELLFRGNLFGHFPRIFYALIMQHRLPFIAAAMKRAHVLEYVLVNPTIAKLRDGEGVPLIDYVLRGVGPGCSREALRAAQLCVRVLLHARAPLSVSAINTFRSLPTAFPVATLTAPGHGDTLLHTAIINNQHDVVTALLDDPNRGLFILKRNVYGLMAWHYAVSPPILRRVIDVTVGYATMLDAIRAQHDETKARIREEVDSASGGGTAAGKAGFGATNLAAVALAALALAHERDLQPDFYVGSIFDEGTAADSDSSAKGATGKEVTRRLPTLRVVHHGVPLVDFGAAVVSTSFLETHLTKSAAAGLSIGRHQPKLELLGRVGGGSTSEPPADTQSVVASIVATATNAPTSQGLAASSTASPLNATWTQRSPVKTVPSSVMMDLWRRCFVCEAEDDKGAWTNRASLAVAVKATMPPAMAARRVINMYASPHQLHHAVAAVLAARKEAEKAAADAALAEYGDVTSPSSGAGRRHDPAAEGRPHASASSPTVPAPPRTRKGAAAETFPPILGAASPLPLLQLFLPKACVTLTAAGGGAAGPDAVLSVSAASALPHLGGAAAPPSPGHAAPHHAPTTVAAAQEAFAALIGTPFEHSGTHRQGYSGCGAHYVGAIPSAPEATARFRVPCEVLRHTEEQRRRLTQTLVEALQMTLFSEGAGETTLVPLYDHARDAAEKVA
jgi:hypothetical protein